MPRTVIFTTHFLIGSPFVKPLYTRTFLRCATGENQIVLEWSRTQIQNPGSSSLAKVLHKVSPKSTVPVHLYSLYSYLQNENTVLLDSRLGRYLMRYFTRDCLSLLLSAQCRINLSDYHGISMVFP